MLRFVVDRHDLRAARWQAEADDAPLADGQARLAVERFALTANNVTYAAFGEAMRYWEFFPTGDAATGCVPVWGFATVRASRCDGVAVGERVYGFWPLAEAAVVQPARLDASGFVDDAPHRRGLHPVYNRYRFCRTDPGYDAAREAEQAILQPLFTTAFLIDDQLADAGFHGARQVVLGSASSKTAIATAFCLARRGGVEVVGLTSAAHLDFVRALGCHGGVLAYDAVATLDAAVPTAYVDMSGSATVRAAVHRHFGERLVASVAVGGTHWSDLAAPGGGERLPGARPTLFFAPAQLKKRQADWGPVEVLRRIGEASQAFLRRASDPSSPWLRVEARRGADAILAAWLEAVDGRADPRTGLMLAF